MRRRALLAVVAASTLASCWSDVLEGERTAARMLDRACEAGECQLTGSARLVEGLTADSVAVEIGPEDGGLDLGIPDGSFSWPEVLIRGTGHLLHPDGTEVAVPSEYGWRALPRVPGSSGREVAQVRLTPGSHVFVADYRMSVSSDACSVVGALPRGARTRFRF